jgi:hypothetical protein
MTRVPRYAVDHSACICARSPACSENLFIGGLLKPPTSSRFSWQTQVRHTEFSFGTIGCF